MWCVFNFFSSRSRNISSCFEKHRSPKMTNCVGGRYRVETRTADESFALGTVRFDDSVVKQFIALKFSKGFSSSLPLFWSPHPSVCQACSLCLLFDFHDNTRNQLYASFELDTDPRRKIVHFGGAITDSLLTLLPPTEVLPHTEMTLPPPLPPLDKNESLCTALLRKL